MQNNNTPYEKIHVLQEGIPAYEALERISKELEKDGLPNYDLGSYTAIEMPAEAKLLIQLTLGKNMINKNEYSQTTIIHERLVKIIGNLLHVPDENDICGSSTTGSSEAIFMALLAAKWRWKQNGNQGDPNLVLCSNAHISWHKSARFLDIQVREVPLHIVNEYPIEAVRASIDENTIGVVAVLGCTYVGFCDPIVQINEMLEAVNTQYGWDVGIHVDAAIGGFVYPFVAHLQKVRWDFRLPLVKSINLSGHKYGLVYPGLGWLLFRDQNCFPEELKTTAEYLYGVSKSFTVSFSRSSSLIIAQQFCFLHYGMNGYKNIIENCLWNAEILTEAIQKCNFLQLVSESTLPIVAFKFTEEPSFPLVIYTELLRKRKWMLPYYKLSGELEDTVMRIVIRKDMTLEMIFRLVEDLEECYKIVKNEYTT
ncbi:glutamate decarboxylase [Aquimarina hainanensis]|uniref:Glutamate decarboxylase n=1 Tax=Aquimarina hainanensis TaxID=1578017 RepID=A0ABW5NBS7_9FLAO|nr:glutamate decarboxylase [Aquimarina sp. TRL1]QKX06935.1 glutamate decarboxylase [Aquimarina sp. TRL1]